MIKLKNYSTTRLKGLEDCCARSTTPLAFGSASFCFAWSGLQFCFADLQSLLSEIPPQARGDARRQLVRPPAPPRSFSDLVSRQHLLSASPTFSDLLSPSPAPSLTSPGLLCRSVRQHLQHVNPPERAPDGGPALRPLPWRSMARGLYAGRVCNAMVFLALDVAVRDAPPRCEGAEAVAAGRPGRGGWWSRCSRRSRRPRPRISVARA